MCGGVTLSGGGCLRATKCIRLRVYSWSILFVSSDAPFLNAFLFSLSFDCRCINSKPQLIITRRTAVNAFRTEAIETACLVSVKRNGVLLKSIYPCPRGWPVY